MRRLQAVRRIIRGADSADLALLDQVRIGAHGFFERSFQVFGVRLI